MCGIAGFVNYKDAPSLIKMVELCQGHRGPDYHGSWVGDNVVLSHQRLSIIDLDKRANQPFIKDGLVIIFNGEIYNYKQIKQRLENECRASGAERIGWRSSESHQKI